MPITSNGHPWGGERESAKMTGLRLPPPNRGLRELSRLRTGGHGSFPDLARVGPVNDDRDGGVGDRTWSSIGRADPSGDCQLTDSIETSTDNLTLHRGHRDDQCGSSSCPEPARTEPSGLSCGSGSGEGRPGSSGSGQGCPGSLRSVEGRPGTPGTVEGCPGSLRSVEGCPGSLRSVEGCPGSSGGCSLRSVEDCPGSLRSVEGCPGSSGGCSLRSVEDCPGSSGSSQGCPGPSGSGQGCSGSSSGCSLCTRQGRSPILSKSFSTSRAWSFALIPRDQAQFVFTTDSQATGSIPGHVAFAFAAFGFTSTGQESAGGTRGRTRLEAARSTSRWGRSAGSIRGSAPRTGSSRYFVPPRRRGPSGSLAVLENAS